MVRCGAVRCGAGGVGVGLVVTGGREGGRAGHIRVVARAAAASFQCPAGRVWGNLNLHLHFAACGPCIYISPALPIFRPGFGKILVIVLFGVI
jgi:hypothetical protein